MRGMTGVELAKKLKDAYPKINIIFVTGFDQYTGEAMKMHASGYIMKPVTAEKVKEEMENLRNPIEPLSDKLLRVQCFGNFDVFILREVSQKKFLHILFTVTAVHAQSRKLRRHSLKMSRTIQNSRHICRKLFRL